MPSARSTSAASGPGSSASGGSSSSASSIGVVVGGLYSLSGGSAWEATARLAPGQAFSPSGSPVFLYLTNPTAINSLATSETTVEQAAAKAGHQPERAARPHLDRGRRTREGTTTQRNAVLVADHRRRTRRRRPRTPRTRSPRSSPTTTTNRYVRQTIEIYQTRKIKNFNQRLVTVQERIDAIDKALAEPGLSLDEQPPAHDPARPGAGGSGPDDRLADDGAAAADPGPGRLADADRPGGAGDADVGALAQHARSSSAR